MNNTLTKQGILKNLWGLIATALTLTFLKFLFGFEIAVLTGLAIIIRILILNL